MHYPPSCTPDDTTDAHRSKRRRWLSKAFIALYLSWLGHGVVCHAMQYRVNAHPAMYFTVWDMFCGWAGWSERIHVVAEGRSGKFYELTPAPWGTFKPFSDLGRHHYDWSQDFAARIGINCLNHTQHEPIEQVHVITESWSKKFNVPDSHWDNLHDEPREPLHYFRTTATFTPNGAPVRKGSSFPNQQRGEWLASSLRGQAPARLQPFVVSGKGQEQ